MSRRKLGRWKDKVKEYMSERGASRGTGLEQAMRDCFGGKDGGCSAIATHLRYLDIYCEIEGSSKRGRPHGRWKDRVQEYMCERGVGRAGVAEQAKMWGTINCVDEQYVECQIQLGCMRSKEEWLCINRDEWQVFINA